MARFGVARGFASAVARITGPNVIGSAISFFATPFLALWFSPQQFGEFAYVLAIASIVSGIVTLRLDVRLYSVAADERRSVSWHATLIASTLTTMLLFVALPMLLLLPTPERAMFAWRIAAVHLSVVALCVMNIGSAYLIAERRYVAAGLPRIVIPVSMVLLATLSHALLRNHELDLLAINVLAMLIGAAFYITRYAQRPTRGAIAQCRLLLHTHARFIVLATLQNTATVAAFLNAGMVVLGHLFGVAAAGRVFMAYRLVGMPSTIMGVGAGNYISAEAGAGRMVSIRIYAAVMAIAGILIYLPLAIVTLLLPLHWVPLEWQGSVDALLPMILLCFTHFVIGSFGQLLLVWNRARAMLMWDCARLILTLLAAIAAWAAGGNWLDALWAFVLAQLPMYVLLGVLLMDTARQQRVAVAALL